MHRHLRLFAGHAESLVDAIRGSYWFVPMLMTLGSIALAFLLIEVGPAITPSLSDRLAWVSASDADGTRDVLSVIAGSMITVTGVVFSITVVALTLASSQFGPRLLRNFLRDRSNQVSLGVFVGTFLYSLIILRAVTEGGVPHLASAVAVVLAAASVFVLIFFIHNTAVSIQASSVIAGVANEIEGQLENLFPERLGEGDELPADEVRALRQRIADTGWDAEGSSEGFIRLLNGEALIRLAAEHDAEIHLLRRPGDFVCEGAVLARVAGAERTRDLEQALRRSFVIGDYRTGVQDLEFLIGQLTEVAVRALSPGVNDPRTAADCARRLGAMVAEIMDREMPSAVRRDDSGRIRIVADPLTFEEIVGRAFDPLRRYGAEHVDVVIACLESLDLVGRTPRDGARRDVLSSQARQLHQALHRAKGPSERDRDAVDAVFARVIESLDDPSTEAS